MWIQRAYAGDIEEAMEPLTCQLGANEHPGDIVVTCVNGTRELTFYIEMSRDPQEFSVKVTFLKKESPDNMHSGRVDPFQETLKALANWLKESS